MKILKSFEKIHQTMLFNPRPCFFALRCRGTIVRCVKNYPVDTGRKLNVYKTFRRHPGRLLHVLFTFNLHPVSTRYDV